MTPESFSLRTIHLLEQEEGEPETWWWLSFTNPDLPKGQQFVGVIIVRARGIIGATQHTHREGINPGGEIMALPMAKIPPKGYTNRLLTRAEVDHINALTKAGKLKDVTFFIER